MITRRLWRYVWAPVMSGAAAVVGGVADAGWSDGNRWAGAALAVSAVGLFIGLRHYQAERWAFAKQRAAEAWDVMMHWDTQRTNAVDQLGTPLYGPVPSLDAAFGIPTVKEMPRIPVAFGHLLSGVMLAVGINWLFG